MQARPSNHCRAGMAGPPPYEPCSSNHESDVTCEVVQGTDLFSRWWQGARFAIVAVKCRLGEFRRAWQGWRASRVCWRRPDSRALLTANCGFGITLAATLTQSLLSWWLTAGPVCLLPCRSRGAGCARLLLLYPCSTSVSLQHFCILAAPCDVHTREPAMQKEEPAVLQLHAGSTGVCPTTASSVSLLKGTTGGEMPALQKKDQPCPVAASRRGWCVDTRVLTITKSLFSSRLSLSFSPAPAYTIS
jgi:hypothetical protein